MDIELKESAFQGQNIVIRVHGILGGSQLLLNGAPAPLEKGFYTLTDNAGKTVKARLRRRFYDPVPVLELDGVKIKIAPSLKWYEYTWMAAPVVVLLFAGGALGAVFGAAALVASATVFRTKINGVLKYLSSLLFSVAGWACFYLFIMIIGVNWVRTPQWHTENFKDFGFSIESPYTLEDENAAPDKDSFKAQMSKQNSDKLPSSCTVSVESFVMNGKRKVNPAELANIAMDEYKADATYSDVEVNTKDAKFSGMDAETSEGSFKLFHLFTYDFKHIFVISGDRIWHISVDYAAGKPELEKTAQKVMASLDITSVSKKK
jgi:hypothetical protein